MKVGDYVRTKDGIIDKVIIEYNGHCANPYCNRKHVSCERNYYDEDKIIKSSPNIIDLIEVGDYVNEKKVLDVAIDYIFDYSEEIKIVYFDIDKKDYIYSKVDIKSIVTKEQFESMEYKVVE